MAKFKFRLQPVIKVKEMQEKKIQRELAEIKKNILEREARIDDLREEREKLVSSSPVEGRIKAGEMSVRQDYFRRISDEIHFENSNLHKLAQSESKKIDEALDVKKDKEAIEKLKEKRLREFKREEEKTEQVLIDSLAQRLGVQG